MSVRKNIKGTAMRKRMDTKHKMAAVFFLLLFMAVIVDFTKSKEVENGSIHRTEIGEEDKELSLLLEIEGVLEDYEYVLEVLPIQPTQEEAENYFKQTIEIIDEDFKTIGETVPLKDAYLDHAVKADWSFMPFGLIDEEGNVQGEKLEKDGTIVQAQVELCCGEYERIYTFSFSLKPPHLSEQERILQQLESWMEHQMSMEGSDQVQLPTEIAGKSLSWSEQREYITPQILLVEVLAVVLLLVISKRKNQEEEKKKLIEMERDYPDIVHQLSLLLGAGMTTRQAWNKLSTQYSYKRKMRMIEEKPVYEAILRMNRRFTEGESERAIYGQFSEEIPAPCYRKLMRILLGNLEKGTKGISIRLEEENRLAFEQSILQAKKMGEEASTKMLMPLMLMLVIVMGIVMLPALLEFQI